MTSRELFFSRPPTRYSLSPSLRRWYSPTRAKRGSSGLSSSFSLAAKSAAKERGSGVCAVEGVNGLASDTGADGDDGSAAAFVAGGSGSATGPALGRVVPPTHAAAFRTIPRDFGAGVTLRA